MMKATLSRLYRKVLVTLSVLVWFGSGAALAQIPAPDPVFPGFDFVAWGKDWYTLSLVVLFALTAIKRPVLKTRAVPAPVWFGLAQLIGVGLAFLLNVAGFGATFGELPAPFGALAYGLLAGLGASLGHTVTKALVPYLLATLVGLRGVKVEAAPGK
jgi:hypothetical protein